jgi:hypothetical protein
MVVLLSWIASCSHVAERPTAVTANDWDGRQLAYAAMACWFGPVWQDALGDVEAVRKADGKSTCRELVSHIWGRRDDKVDYERLRAFEGTERIPGVNATLTTAIGAEITTAWTNTKTPMPPFVTRSLPFVASSMMRSAAGPDAESGRN